MRNPISPPNYTAINGLPYRRASRIGARRVAAQSPSARCVTSPSRCRQLSGRGARRAWGRIAGEALQVPARWRWRKARARNARTPGPPARR